LACVKKDGKSGFINTSGKFIIEPNYYWCGYFESGIAQVIKDSNPEWIKINKEGNIQESLSTLNPVSVDSKRGYSDQEGKIIIKPVFDKAFHFSENLAVVGMKKSEVKWGFIDKKGAIVIKPIYSSVGQFSEGLASILLVENDKYGYINKAGEVVIEPKFDCSRAFSSGLAVIQKGDCNNGKSGYIDKEGNIVIDTQYDWACNFSEGLACVKKDGKWGYINSSGEYIIQSIYDYAGLFSEGMALVHLKGKKYFIDKNGKNVLEPDCDNCIYAESFSDGLIKITINGKDGYMDKTGEIVIKPKYGYAQDFSEGFAIVSNILLNDFDNMIYIIDKEGKEILTTHNLISNYSEGLARVYTFGTGHKSHYINKKGEVVIEPIPYYSGDFSEGLAPVAVYVDD